MSIRLRVVAWLLVTATVVASTACATVTRPYMNRVALSSDPPPAAVTADGDPVGETPVTVAMSRGWWEQGRGGRCSGSRNAGSFHGRSEIDRRVNRWVFGNLVLAAIAGALTVADTDSPGDWTPVRVAAGTLRWSTGIDFLSGSLFVFPRTFRTTLAPTAAVHLRPAGSR